MSSELHVYQLQLDYLRSTEYDITASLRAYVRACARWVEANCVIGYVSLAKLDCFKSSKRESTPCRLYVGETFPIPRRTIFSSPSSSSSASTFFVHVSRVPARKLHRKFPLHAACLLARDSSNQWIFSEKHSRAVPVKGFLARVTTFPLFSISFPVQMQSACGRARDHDFYSQCVCANNF